MTKRIAAIAAAALILFLALYSSFNADILQAVVSSELVGPYERGAIRAVRSNEERGADLTVGGRQVRFPLPNGAVEFNSAAYPVPEGAVQFLARAEAWRQYEQHHLAAHGFIIADQLGSLLIITHDGIERQIELTSHVYTRLYRRFVIHPRP